MYIEAAGIAPRGLLPLDKIQQFEKDNGEIKAGDIITIRFGWDEKYDLQPDGAEYLKD